MFYPIPGIVPLPSALKMHKTTSNTLIALTALILGCCPMALSLTPQPYQIIFIVSIIILTILLLITFIRKNLRPTPPTLIGQMIRVLSMENSGDSQDGNIIFNITFKTLFEDNQKGRAVGLNNFRFMAGYNAHVVSITGDVLVLTGVTVPKPK